MIHLLANGGGQGTATTTLRAPKPATLRKYGLSLAAWESIAGMQGYVCFVCHQVPKSGTLHVDHFHAKGWKKMPPAERRKFVRGLLCFRCNTSFVGRGVTVERSRRVVEYLERFERWQSGSFSLPVGQVEDLR